LAGDVDRGVEIFPADARGLGLIKPSGELRVAFADMGEIALDIGIPPPQRIAVRQEILFSRPLVF
jgi:hypothetical protein